MVCSCFVMWGWSMGSRILCLGLGFKVGFGQVWGCVWGGFGAVCSCVVLCGLLY